jgi:hypothetical protein
MTAELSQTLPKSSKIGYASFVFCCSGRVCLVTFLQQQAVQESRTRNDAPECASMDARHSFQATIVRWRHTFFSTATDALIASASSMLATCSGRRNMFKSRDAYWLNRILLCAFI